MKGLIVSLYESDYPRPHRFGNDKGGHAFGDVKSVVVVGIFEDGTIKDLPKDSQVFEPRVDTPPALLVVRRTGKERVLSVAPLDYHSRRWYMNGGAFASTSDSRWSALVGFYGAVHVHDRYEE